MTSSREPSIRVVMMPKDTNAHGTIFGGVILSYIDQAAAVEAKDGDAVAVMSHNNAGLSQDQIKSMFFDAARQGRDDLLGGLIQSGMKPDERDAHGYTALILAAYNGQPETVDFLIGKGADPCAVDAKGNNALMGVAFKGETDVAQRLLQERCNVNAANGAGQTALMMGALFGRTGWSPYQMPPRATVIASPFTPPAASLQRNTITSATSRGSNTRFCG